MEEKECEHHWENAGGGASNDSPYLTTYFKCPKCGKVKEEKSIVF